MTLTRRLQPGNVDVRVALPPEPTRIAADQDLIERMVKPLLDNAVRYGRSVVEVSLVRNGSTATIRIVDDGPGVAAEEAARIIEPGLRGEAAASRADRAGLGLSLAGRRSRSARRADHGTARHGRRRLHTCVAARPPNMTSNQQERPRHAIGESTGGDDGSLRVGNAMRAAPRAAGAPTGIAFSRRDGRQLAAEV